MSAYYDDIFHIHTTFHLLFQQCYEVILLNAFVDDLNIKPITASNAELFDMFEYLYF